MTADVPSVLPPPTLAPAPPGPAGTAPGRRPVAGDGAAPAWRALLGVLLPALLLAGLATGAHAVIGQRVHDRVRADLDAAGQRWVQVTVSGQHVVLHGREPAAGAARQALQTARAARCPTWTGPRPCADRVESRFTP